MQQVNALSVFGKFQYLTPGLITFSLFDAELECNCLALSLGKAVPESKERVFKLIRF